jgi:hypothetical protein
MPACDPNPPLRFPETGHSRRLLDYPVRTHQYRLRDRDAKRLGGLQIYDQLELRRLLDGQITGFCASEYLVYERAESGRFALAEAPRLIVNNGKPKPAA